MAKKSQAVHLQAGLNQTSPPACNFSSPQFTMRWKKTTDWAKVTCARCIAWAIEKK